MSQKITSKNLTYDNSLPPFLARLRGQQAAHTGPDPFLAAQRRPGQKRSASEEAEDAPVVVDEDGNVVYLADGLLEDGSGDAQPDDKEKGEENHGEKESPNSTEEGDLAPGKDKEKVAGIGASRKRKAGRVIGEERSDDDNPGNAKGKKTSDAGARIAKASAAVRRLVRQDEDDAPRRNTGNGMSVDGHKPPRAADDKKTIKSAKRKPAKKIKLSFGDNDDGE